MESVTPTPAPYKVAQFVNWFKQGELDLNPEFQRRAVWRPGAQSYLIDTMIRGYLIPPIYLRDLPTNTRTLKSPKQVVDGQQRLRAAITFVAPAVMKARDSHAMEFVLSDAHSQFGGKSFADLPKKIKERILDYQFSVHTFDSRTSDAIILQNFARMNSTGTKLNEQELRNAKFYGYFKSLAYDLGAEYLSRWQEWGVFKPSQVSRMDEVELTSDLMILMLRGITAKTKTVLDAAYKSYDAKFAERHEVARRFRHVMDLFASLAPGGEIGHLKTKTLFYAGFAATYERCFRIGSALKRKKPRSFGSDRMRRLLAAAERVEMANVPGEVFAASTVRVTNAIARRALVPYLAKSVR